MMMSSIPVTINLAPFFSFICFRNSFGITICPFSDNLVMSIAISSPVRYILLCVFKTCFNRFQNSEFCFTGGVGFTTALPLDPQAGDAARVLVDFEAVELGVVTPVFCYSHLRLINVYANVINTQNPIGIGSRMAEVSLETVYHELMGLREEMIELKELLLSEPSLRKEIIRKVNEARRRIKREYVSHEKVVREFLK